MRAGGGAYSLFVPDPVCGRRRDVDRQRPRQLSDLHGEQQRRVGHLLQLLLDEVALCRLLEVLGFSDFVHKSQNLPSSLPSSRPVGDDERRLRVWMLNQRLEELRLKPSENHLGVSLFPAFRTYINQHTDPSLVGVETFSPAGPRGSDRSSSSSSDEAALDDSSSLSANTLRMGLELSGGHTTEQVTLSIFLSYFQSVLGGPIRRIFWSCLCEVGSYQE